MCDKLFWALFVSVIIRSYILLNVEGHDLFKNIESHKQYNQSEGPYLKHVTTYKGEIEYNENKHVN